MTWMYRRVRFSRGFGFAVLMLAAVRLCVSPGVTHAQDATVPTGDAILQAFPVDDASIAEFWRRPETQAFRQGDPLTAAALVPLQAGLRYCRCPGCGAEEIEETLLWSPSAPDRLSCRRCRGVFPNDSVPAKADGKIPAVVFETLTGVTHTYPYHQGDVNTRRYPEEKMFLQARIDTLRLAFVTQIAYHAALRSVRSADAAEAAGMARLAAVILTRCAQVYPFYALHEDAPGNAKIFQRADLPGPYRARYATGKWTDRASTNLPIPLVIAAHAIQGSPAWDEAGRLLKTTAAENQVRAWFQSAATFVKQQPDAVHADTIVALLSLRCAGRYLKNNELLAEAERRRTYILRQGFTADGVWLDPRVGRQREILAMLARDERLALGADAPQNANLAKLLRQAQRTLIALDRPIGPNMTNPDAVNLAGFTETDSSKPQSLPNAKVTPEHLQGPLLLGSAGMTRLEAGTNADALTLETRGFANPQGGPMARLSTRLFLGGAATLGDLDDMLVPSAYQAWAQSSMSRNTLLIDGRSQRETRTRAVLPAPGAKLLHHIADPSLQVAVWDDPQAYPTLAKKYRQTIVTVAGKTTRYAVNIWDVQGGVTHEQILHSAPGLAADWQAGPDLKTSVALSAKPSDFPTNIDIMEHSAEYLLDRKDRDVTESLYADLQPRDPARPGVRIHILGDFPLQLTAARTPGPVVNRDCATLIIRRKRHNNRDEGSSETATPPIHPPGPFAFSSRIITLMEPRFPGQTSESLLRIGYVRTQHNAVTLMISGPEGVDHLMINLAPGSYQTVKLGDGRTLVSDGIAVRVSADAVTLAGGTHAKLGGVRVKQPEYQGMIESAVEKPSPENRPQAPSAGWMETPVRLPDPHRLNGQTLFVEHGDGVRRAWTIVRAQPLLDRGTRIYVRERPGFTLTGDKRPQAKDTAFPNQIHPGPHKFAIDTITKLRP